MRKRPWFKSQRSRPPSSTSAIPQKGEREANDENEINEDDWREIVQEERMAKVKQGEIRQLKFDAEFGS
jgi:hypothetical protein